MSDNNKPTVFISYSHNDEAWKDRLFKHLKALELANRVTVWHDRKIDPGGKWANEIQEVMANAAVSVCLISPDYLASDFCVKEEVPYLLFRHEHGMVFIPVLLRPCPWKAFDWLDETQMIPRDGQSIAEDFAGREDGVFAQIANQILDIVDNPDYELPPPPPPKWTPPDKIDIDRLPVTGSELFGRRTELAWLDEIWETDNINVVSLVAWGGVGKSTLVNKWLEQMEADNYRGARRVYGWSFYSQGTNERVTSADQFMAAALEWFGDPDPTEGSPWDKGRRLADLVRQAKTLLLLDGLEPLQEGFDYERGKIKDPGLATLLAELARRNPGLCVITTRERVADLAPCPETTAEKNLELISANAGRALLRVGGVKGTDDELEATVKAFGGHALALNLLGSFLHDIPGHHASHAAEIADLPNVAVGDGKHPRRVMAAFAERFGDGPEVNVLRILGLFDRPAEPEAITAVRAAPAIPGLTNALFESTDEHRLTQIEKKASLRSSADPINEQAWQQVIARLRRAGLVAPESTHRPGVLDAHPLVREHFGAELELEYPDAWREGHSRLYEYFKTAAPELPDTLEEMVPLFAAVGHGCRAGRHQETLDEVYWERILRGNEFYSSRKLGAMGSNLTALSGFFDPPWRQTVTGLLEARQGFVLNEVGFYLRALGRLAEAVQPMQSALEMRIAQENWKNAAINAGNLSELTLTNGDVSRAIAYAQQSVELADRSGDAFQRMGKRTTLADALHQAGRLDEAEAEFEEAEVMQKEDQPEYPLLYSQRGFRYCDLLLSQGQAQAVQRRAAQTIEIAKRNNWLLGIALDNLSLGRAYLLQAQEENTGEFIQAATHLEQAVEGFHRSGDRDMLALGLLARAGLRRVLGELERATVDVEEAMTIATRGGMRLFEADAHLEYARLYLAQGETAPAREHLAKAAAMIEEMGYHRRDPEVAELEEALGKK